ncbi:MAG: class I SAM-dependent methyltransferase [Phycisphaerales bacterium]
MPSEADTWKAYFDAVAGLPARETLTSALARFEGGMGKPLWACPCEPALSHGQAEDGLPMPPGPRFAIDLGCGEGRDTLELLRRGWRVLAIDSTPEAIDRLRAQAEAILGEEARATGSRPSPAATRAEPRLRTRIDRFETAPLPPCDLLNASFSIPHCDPADFPGIWSRIVAAIRPGGRFAGQLFGVLDSWATEPEGITRTHHTRGQVEALLAPFEVELLDEVERDGKTALGDPKYWHVFHIVARKRGHR